VRHVESWALLDVVPLGSNGAPAPGTPTESNTVGSVSGLFFNQDRVTITDGRMADPTRPNEVVLQSSQAPPGFVGHVVPLGIFTNAQESQPGFGTTRVLPYRRVNAKVVGLGVTNDAVVADAVDAGGSVLALFTPAFTQPLLTCCTKASKTAVQVEGGSRNVAAVEGEIEGVLPKGFNSSFYVTSATEAKAERAVKPESIALGVFGGIAALAALLITGQAIGRQLRIAASDLSVLRALGASPSMTASDGLIGIGVAIVIGGFLALAVAVAMSPLAPIGPVRMVDPSPGIAFDWTVLGLGVLVLVGCLGVAAVALALRHVPHRVAQRRQLVGERRSSLAHAAAASGLPVSAVTGIRFAVVPGVGSNTVPVRSAILGTSLAIVVVTATLTFGASLHTLVSHPALYGWNWDYALAAGGGSGDIPEQLATRLLDHDSDVAAWSGVYFGTLQLDGVPVPVLGAAPGARVAPPILSGHAFDAPDQVVLGANTLAQLHKHIGDTIVVSNGLTAPTHLRIVGTATLPAIGLNFVQHPTMGTGALLSYTTMSAFDRNFLDDPVTGPNAILVRLRHGASVRSLQRIANETSTTANFGVSLVPVQRPAEIVNYRSLGTTPAILGAALGVGAAVALGLTLVASVRRRRRDLALLKTLGFTQRQLAATVAWQSSVAVIVGIVVGVPLGIVLGRFMWDLFAREISAVPAPSVPAFTVVLIAVGALVLANLVAAVPGRIAAKTPTAVLLRAE
jgi:FtsX-like permease family